MHGMLDEVRSAVRRLIRRPGRATAILLTLALGIGLNTALFRVVDDVLLRPLPFAQAQRVVAVHNGWLDLFTPGHGFHTGLTDWWSGDAAFETTAAMLNGAVTLRGDGRPVRVQVAAVTANYFSLLGVHPLLGRPLDARDIQAGRPVAVIGESLWQSRWGGRADVIGKSVQLNGSLVTITGVVPDALTAPLGVHVWIPASATGMQVFHGSQFQEHMLALLRPGVTLAAAQQTTTALARRLLREQAEVRATPSMHGWAMPAGMRAASQYPRLIPLREHMVGKARPALVLLWLTGLFVLLVACVNVANLLLARGTEQAGEMAIRAALGASRGRLVTGMLAESSLLALAGGAAGLWMALVSGPLLLRAMPAGMLPSLQLQAGDWTRMLGFATVAALGCVLLCGLGPALAGSKAGLQPVLTQSHRFASQRVRSRLTPAALIAVEAGFTLVLLAGAVLLVRSFATLMAVPSGMKTAGVLAAQLPADPSAPATHSLAVEQQMLERARRLPGVTSAALANYVPFPQGSVNILPIWKWNDAPATQPVAVLPLGVTADYFRTLGMPLLKGRAFNEQDTATGERVVIVSAGLARRLWPGRNPIGHRLRVLAQGTSLMMPAPGSKQKMPALPPATVVGVVGDAHHLGPAGPVFPALYAPRSQFKAATPWLLLRSGLPSRQVAAELRQAANDVAPSQLVTQVMTLAARRDADVAGRRFPTLLLGLFAALALALTAIGIYGVLSFFVARQRQEIGIRMAIGARPADVLWQVGLAGLRPVLIGLAAGLAASLGLARYLRSLLFHVKPTDGASMAASAAVLLAVATAAILLPAWRAAQCDPVEVLRAE